MILQLSSGSCGGPAELASQRGEAALLAPPALALVDVLSSSLVVKDFALLITHGMGIYGDQILLPSAAKDPVSQPC